MKGIKKKEKKEIGIENPFPVSAYTMMLSHTYNYTHTWSCRFVLILDVNKTQMNLGTAITCNINYRIK